ncbi:hypothetical protein ACH5RR_040302 [Cinchona calisaya]|uniref:Fe2OG dioxygenase domain-containing protein n=1 Tax=Cinchona calisaya TaxID=153742 RepID=A0ABD2XU55_9GENT
MGSSNNCNDMQVPLINLSLLQQDSQTKSHVIKQIHQACTSAGIFNVINHGLSETLIEEVLKVNANFFELPLVTKEGLISDDILKPVRFSTNQGGAQGIFRDFLKLYAHPLEEFLNSWPNNPPDYRDKMGRCAVEMRKLGIQILGAIMESLNLETTFLKDNIEQGMHMVAINSYPPISESKNIKKIIGAPQHTDHSIITILLQSSSGLQVMDRNDKNTWKYVPKLKGSLLVFVGDHLEVLSNGKYKSVLHRVVYESCDETRLSIASFQSLGMDEVLEPAIELVDEEHPKQYKGSSLRDFLKHLASGESKPFIETLKISSETMEE